MADTFTGALKARKIEQGAYSNSYAARFNEDMVDVFDAAIAGQLEIDIGSSTTHALEAMANGTLSDSHYFHLRFVGTPASAVTVTVPASVTPSKEYLVENQTGQALTFKYAATTGVTVQDGDTVAVRCNGTNVTESVFGPRYKITAAEIAAGVTPSDFSIPSHDEGGVIIPQRYFPQAAPTTVQMYAVMQNCWDVALESGCDIYAPAGTYDVGIENLPFRQSGTPVTLLDCLNITVFGDGPATVFQTTSVDGADVFQLNGLKNFHLRNLSIQATISGSTSGSNGISVTNGWDNITIDGVHCLNLESLDDTANVDGGKALTIQPSTTVCECGTLKARIYVKGCAGGFDYDPVLTTSDDKKTSIDVELVAEDCYRAVAIGSPAAGSAISSSYSSGVRVSGQAINCQRDVHLDRVHGVQVDIQVITTKTAAARRLDPNGVAWIAADTTVEALRCLMAHRSQVRVCGNKGACDYKARIGATSAGSSGLIGSTDDSDIFLDLGGTAATADVAEVDSGGNTLRNSRLQVSTVTATSLPTAFYVAALNNLLLIGYQERGSFTGTLTGCTTSPTVSVAYSAEDDIVVLTIPGVTATSNTTACTVTGMPAGIRPAAAQNCMGFTTDSGTTAAGRIIVETSGTLTLHVGISATFTNSGTKGLQSIVITYRRR
jgi:hypothetical protein